MESDSTLSATALGIALVVFVLSSLMVAELNALRWQRLRGRIPTSGMKAWAMELLQLRLDLYTDTAVSLRLASVTAATVATVALVLSQVGTNWGAVALTTLGLWLTLALLRNSAQATVDYFTLSLVPPLALPTLVAAWPLAPLARIATPLSLGLKRLWRSPQLPQDGNGPQESHPEVLPLMDSHQEPLDPQEQKMIRAILRLEETAVREIMVPRVDILAAEVDTKVAEVAAMMLEGGHSRIPIYEENIDNVVGMVHARDLLRFLGQPDQPTHLRDLARPAFFIPDSKRVDELLREMQEKRIHTMIVVDEYGGTAGMLTIEDLLEEIVGEIADDLDVEESTIEMVGEHEAVMDARVTLDQLNEALSIQLSGEGFDTLGGFVYSQLGKIPNPGDAVVSDGLRLQVLSTVGRRIKKIRVTKTQEADNQH